MSKRFGRNQKRKLIADRDGLAELVKREAQRVSGLQYNMQRNAETVRLVEEILGSHFFGLPPREFTVDRLGYGLRIPAMSRRMALECEHPETLNLQEKLFLLQEAQYDEQRDLLRNARHFRYVTPAGEVAYAATDLAWNGMSNDQFEQRMREEISESMAAYLVHHRRKV